MTTEISTELLAAYQATEYRVEAMPEPFCLSIGQYSAALARLLDDSECHSAAFISAHNPFSEPHGADTNALAHEQLKQALEDQSTILIEGAGRDPAGLWPEEKSVLAIGLELEQARRVATRFGQNAMVWVESDAVPELVLLR